MSKRQQEKVHKYITYTNIFDSDCRQVVFVADGSFISVYNDRETADVSAAAIPITTRVIMVTTMPTTTVITATIVIPSATIVINDYHGIFHRILILAHKEQCDLYQSTLACETSNSCGDSHSNFRETPSPASKERVSEKNEKTQEQVGVLQTKDQETTDDKQASACVN